MIRLFLMGQGCLYYVMAILDQNANATKQTKAPFEKLFLIGMQQKKNDEVIFNLRIFGVLRIVEENTQQIWNPEEIRSKQHVFLCKNIDLKI